MMGAGADNRELYKGLSILSEWDDKPLEETEKRNVIWFKRLNYNSDVYTEEECWETKEETGRLIKSLL